MAKKIRCEWAEKRRFVTNPDGQVWPCCYFANLDYFLQNSGDVPGGHKWQAGHKVYKAYDSDRQDYNVFNKPAHEILEGKWFTETLPNSWEGEDSDRQFLCTKHCEVDDE
jgi:hypothetical protein